MVLLRSVFRRRIIRPEPLLEHLVPVLAELAQMFEALGPFLEEPRWTEAGKRLDELVELLRKPTEYYLAIKAEDEQRDRNRLAALEQLVKRIPRKGQARAQLRRRG